MFIKAPLENFSPFQTLGSAVTRIDVQAQGGGNGQRESQSLVMVQLSTAYGDFLFAFEAEHAKELFNAGLKHVKSIEDMPIPSDLIIPEIILPPNFDPRGPDAVD